MSAAANLLARRSNSTTSLAQFYREHNPNYEGVRSGNDAPELDFCNAFWGEGDAGFEVIMARTKASARTIDDLKVFMKERATIEEEYGKKLSKLSKQTLGKDETGELRLALEALRVETDKQAGGRLKLAGEIRKDVELPIQDMANKIGGMRKNYQANIEKLHKNKLSQEAHVAKTRERYEQDCLRINSYTANTSLVQGKDLEKLHSKLEKVQQTVGGNEREYKACVRLLEETTRKWETEWKTFCDHVQDIEEERINFIKDNAWNLANAISSVCVTDDESCERIRIALEGFEDVTEIEAFVRSYGTGAKIPDPPLFIDYAKGEAYHTDKTARVATFPRATTRSGLSLPSSALMSSDTTPSLSEVSPEAAVKSPVADVPKLPTSPAPLPLNSAPTAGRDGPAVTSNGPSVSQANRVASPAPTAGLTPSMSAPRPPSAFGRPASVFGHAPPAQTGPSAIRPSPSGIEEDDPLARQLAELRRDPPPVGSIRRGNSVRRPESVTGSVKSTYQSRAKSPGPVHPYSQPPQQQQQQTQPPQPRSQQLQPEFQPQPQYGEQQGQAATTASYRQSYPGHSQGRQPVDTSLVPPAPGHTAAELARSKAEHERRNSRHYPSGQEQGYNNAAQDIVGNHPASRPGTPSGQQGGAARAPSPAFMQPPVVPASPIADQVLDQYHQAFPGERSRSRAGSVNSAHSRANSRMGGSFSAATGQAIAHAMARAPSPNPAREGFVGIGAGARSPSPQPGAHHSMTDRLHATSPAPSQVRSTTPGGSWAAGHRYSQSHAQPSSQPGTMQRPQSQSTRYFIHGHPSQSVGQDQRQSMYGGSQTPVTQPPQPQPLQGVAGGHGTYGSTSSQSRYNSVSSPHVNPQSQYGSMNSLTGQPPHGQYMGQSATSPSPYGQPAPQTSMYSPGPPVQSPTGFPDPANSAYQQAPQAQSGYQAPNPSSGRSMGYNSQPGQYRPSSTAPSPALVQMASQYQGNPVPRAVSPAPPHIQTPVQQQPNQYYGGPPQQQQRPSVHAQQSQHQYGNPAYNPVQPQQQHRQQQPAAQEHSHGGRSPSPQPPPVPVDTPPTGQYSTTGQPVLFFKALYDYQAQSDSEFDFQEGDIIAVTATPPDGWWSGELLDEARRIAGRTDFPSNFVTLF
ncbi:hypothetical protein QFC21_000142 [Naganishia friedmannii]|uniref:Uncharacterized protein n=1 Tax=Naganishia friedmannii TaxID=89922 RepID=A0ACC2WCL9_9TREE|nr:hypothetical protein QFC21_000142 [Naganishia friedmannii]